MDQDSSDQQLHLFKPHYSSSMNRSDVIMVIAGLAVVLIIGLAVQQPSLSLPWKSEAVLDPSSPGPISDSIFLTPFEQEEPSFSYPVSTIQLVDNPFGYPRAYMPGTGSFQSRTYQIIDGERYEVFPLFGSAPYTTAQIEAIATIEWITVGLLEQRRGGVSTIFSIPETPFLRIRTEVTADRFPGQAQFRYVLCDAETGSILDGGEVIGRGSMRSVLVSSKKEMYFIISATSVDGYRIFLEVPREHL